MDINKKARERISAFADGELDDSQLDEMLSSLRHPESKDDWELYHRIGDILRSDDMAVSLSKDFSARMAERLQQEPTIVVPLAQPEQERQPLVKANHMGKRWALPGAAAAAAVAAAVFISGPHLSTLASKSGDSTAERQEVVQTVAQDVDGVVVRDPRIDDYLLAHQRFSPSVYSTAQYARSATFEDSKK